MSHIKENILEKIRKEKLETRPRLYFTLKVVALVTLTLAILVISIFILNFILFSIRLNNQDELLGFGPRGFWTFLKFFPWAWLILDLIFIGFLQSLVRRFEFGYKIPVLRLLAGIFVLTVLLGFGFDRGTDLNDRIFRTSPEGFYGHARRPIPPRNGICKCTILAIEGNKLIVSDNRFGTTTTLSVILPPNDPHATTTSLKVGDTVFVAGDARDGMMYAFGVRKIIIHDQIPRKNPQPGPENP